MMKREVYPSSVVQEVAGSFNWVFYDVDDPANASVAQAYAVRAIPMIVLEDAQGKRLGQMVGGTTPENFRAFLQKAL
jgi:thioredoxin-related protein